MIRRVHILMSATAFCALAATSPLAAQSAPADAASAQQRSFAIPAGRLSQAVLALSEQAGVQVIFDSDTTSSANGNAVNGSLTLAHALDQLLGGTGLRWRWLRAGVVTIEATSVDGERVTSAVRVQGAQGSPYYGGAGVAAGVNGINGSRDITATEGTGSFTSGALTVGSKLPKPMKDVPVTVSVLTSARIQEQNITDFREAMDRLPGVTLIQNGSSTETQFISRGFMIDSIQVDGGAPLARSLVNNLYNIYQPQIDMSQYDHIELLRGAAGLFNGYGNPSGTVNLVRKKPLDHGQVTWEGQIGSWQNYRTVLDASSPLAFDGHLRGRIVMTYQNNHYFYKTAKDNKTLIYGIADLDITPSTLLTGGFSYTRQNSVPWSGGLPRYQDGSDLNLPRSFSLVLPWNRWDLDTFEQFGTLEQKIGSHWTAKLNVTHNYQTLDTKMGTIEGMVRFGPEIISTLYGGSNYSVAAQWTAELSVGGDFTIFGQRQEVLFGVSRARITQAGSTRFDSPFNGSPTNPYIPYPGGPKYYYGSPDGDAPKVDVLHFDPRDPRFSEPGRGLKSQVVDDGGQTIWVGYANFLFTAFDRLHLATGLRFSSYTYNSDSTDYCTRTTGIGCVGRNIGDVVAYKPFHADTSDTDFSWPPAVTLSYDVTKSLTTHLSYTDIYQSHAEYLTPELKPIPPKTGSNIELGVKWAPKDGKLNVSVAAYRVRLKGFEEAIGIQDYNLTDDERSTGATFFVKLPDGRRIRGNYGSMSKCCFQSHPDWTLQDTGVDVELSGEVAEGLQMSAAYTYSKTETQGSPYVEEGLPFESRQPLHLFKTWASYNFGTGWSEGPLSHLTMSGGLSWRSKAYRSGRACLERYIQPDPVNDPTYYTCPPGKSVAYAYTQAPYALLDLRFDYRVNKAWSVSLNVDNVTDKRYYQTMGSSTSDNWYGAPRSFTLTARGKW